MAWSARWKELSLFRRVLLVLLAAMILGFGAAAPIIASRRGIEYGDTLLYLEEQGETRRYSGRLDGERAVFTVSSGGSVEYQWGGCRYGPYQVLEDPTAAPQGDWAGLPGIEIRRGDEVLFRGGYVEGSRFLLIREDGEPVNWGTIRVYTSTGEAFGEDGRVIGEEELHEPSLTFLARIVLAPELTHRGSLGLYFAVTLLAAFNMFQICFPTLMFRLSLLGRVRSAADAEPSDFYIAMEQLEWIVLTVVVFVLYWMSLTTIH